jgi:hypothetical protein
MGMGEGRERNPTKRKAWSLGFSKILARRHPSPQKENFDSCGRGSRYPHSHYGSPAFQKNHFLSTLSVVEYVESETYNVMVYELETPQVTVIWLFEGPEEESSTS